MLFAWSKTVSAGQNKQLAEQKSIASLEKNISSGTS